MGAREDRRALSNLLCAYVRSPKSAGMSALCKTRLFRCVVLPPLCNLVSTVQDVHEIRLLLDRVHRLPKAMPAAPLMLPVLRAERAN